MKQAIARMALVALTTVALYALALTILALAPGIDIRLTTPISWVGALAVAVVFAGWNL